MTNIIFMGGSAVLPVANFIAVVDEFDFERMLRLDENAFGVLLCDNRHEGHAVIRTLRAGRVDNPIYVLMHGQDAGHEMAATLLNAGADQVEQFPVDRSLFEAQIDAIRRRGNGNPDPIIRFGNMVYNTTVREISADGVAVHLSELESRIFAAIVGAQGKTLRKSQIIDVVYGYDNDETPHEKLVDVVVCKLRRKMIKVSGGRDFIMTNWGYGYYFVPEGFHPNIRQTVAGPQRYETERRGPVRTQGRRWKHKEAAE